MVDYFEGMVEKPDALSGLVEENVVPEIQADPNRTARLAAITDVNVLDTDVGAQVEELVQLYQQQIEVAGDGAIRTKAATNQREIELRALTSLASTSTDDTLVQGARAAAVRVIQDDIEKKKEAALEQEAIKRIQDLAGRDRTQAKILLNEMELGNADERIADINTKYLILQREIEKAGIAKQDQGWFFGLMDFVVGSIPFNNSMSSAGIYDSSEVVKSWGDWILSGRRKRAEAASLWNAPAADFSQIIRDQILPNVRENSTLAGYHNRGEELALLSDLVDTPEALETNLWNGLDNFGFLPLAKAGKAGSSVTGAMVRNGARKEAADAVARALTVAKDEGAEAAVKKTGITPQEAADSALPSAVNPDPVTSIPLAGETTSALDRVDELIKRLPETLASDRFASEEEFKAALDRVKKRLEADYGRELVDVQVVERQLAVGSKVRDLDLILGKKEGGAFKSEKSAKAYLASIGNAGEVIRDESGGYFVKLRKPIPETGFYAQELKPQGAAEGTIRGNTLNARLLGDKLLADQAQRGTNQLNKTLKAVVEPLVETINKLDTKSKERVGAVLSRGRRDGVWYDPSTRDMLYERAFGRPMNKAEHEAYQAMRDASDLEYLIRSDDVYLQKHVKGFETVSFDTGRGGLVEFENALVNRSLENIKNGERYYNVGKGIHLTNIDEATVAQLKSEGYILVSLERRVKLSDETFVKNFLIKAQDANIQPLRRDQLPYRAGGRTFYGDKYFGKQAVWRRQGDTGEKFLDSPSTFVTGTKAEVDEWTARMESARIAYNRMADEDGVIDADVIDDIFEGSPMSGEDFLKGIEDGTFQKDTPFVTRYDRELPGEYIGSNEYAEDGATGWLRTNGRMYYSPKGQDLPDYMGREARIIDPYEAINKSLTNVAYLSSFADYKLSATERWVKTYRPYLDYKNGASDINIFSDSVFKKGVNQKLINQAQKQRELIRRTIGWRTEMDLKNDLRVRNILEWVNGSDPSGVRNTLARNMTNWYDNNNPAEALRALAFDAKLGMFNIVQLPLQLSTVSAILTLSPKYAMGGVGNMLFLRQYLTKSGTEHYLNELTKRGVHKLSGFNDAQEFKAFMKASKKSGFLDVGGTHGMINSAGPHATISEFGNSVDKVRQAGRFFFNEGEILNRSVAMNVAWKETREKFPKLAVDSPEFIRRWEGRSEEYAFNMSRESQAWWQRGILSIPTQFWAYQARVLEAMLGNTFTPRQRLQLVLGQTLMYGSAGLPLAGLVTDAMNAEQGGAPPISTMWGAAQRGLVDTVMFHMTGADASFERYASGSWINTVVKDILGYSQYGEKSLGELAVGATGNSALMFGKDVGAIVDKMLKYSTAEAGGDILDPITSDDLWRLATNISSVSNVHKFMLIQNYGTFDTRKGQTIFADLPPAFAWESALLGAGPGAQHDLTAKMAYLKDKKKQIEEASRVFENYRVKMLQQPERADELAREVNTYSRLLPPEIRTEALKRTHKNIPDSLYDGVSEQIQKERMKEEAARNGEPN